MDMLGFDHMVSEGSQLKEGDNIVVRWNEMEDCINHASLDTGESYFIKYDKIIGVIKENRIDPINGNVIIRGFDQKDDYFQEKKGWKGEYAWGIVEAVANDVKKVVSVKGNEMIPIDLKVGDKIYFPKIWAFPVQDEPYNNMDENYYYINSLHVAIDYGIQ